MKSLNYPGTVVDDNKFVLSVIAAVLWVWFNDAAGSEMPFTIAIGVLIVLIGIGLRYFIGSAVES